MKKIATVFMVIFVFSLLAACFPVTAQSETAPFVPSITMTSDNWTYVDFGKQFGLPGDYVPLISDSIRRWEELNPDRRIVSMQIIFQQQGYLTAEVTYGISIYSELR